MPVQNIECQIAQAQITRLLAGDSFSNEVLAALESHIAECADCRRHVSNRRSALEAMVAEDVPARPAAPESKIPDVNLLRAQFKPGQEDPIESELEPRQTKPASTPIRKAAVQTHSETTTVQSFWKPLGYSGALAAVLFAMSYVMKNPTAIFGDKAVETLSTQPQIKKSGVPAKTTSLTAYHATKAASTTPPEAAPKPGNAPIADKPSLEPKPSILVDDNSPTTEPIERIGPIVATPRAHTPGARHHLRIRRKPAVVRHRPKPNHRGSSLRIYGSDGSPIN